MECGRNGGKGAGVSEVCKLKPHLIIRDSVTQGTGCETTLFGGYGVGTAKFKLSYNITGLQLSLLS